MLSRARRARVEARNQGLFARRDPGRDKPPPSSVNGVLMILSASQFYFWYFAAPSLLAPDEDRSA
jgi:hypothetical protein